MDANAVHLHLGVEARHLAAVNRELSSMGGRVLPLEGDGWNTWGEPVATDRNNDRTLHLVAEFDDPVHDLLYAQVDRLIARSDSSDRAFRLATSGDGLSTLAVITSPQDYNVDDSGGHVWSRGEAGVVTHAVFPSHDLPAPSEEHALDVVPYPTGPADLMGENPLHLHLGVQARHLAAVNSQLVAMGAQVLPLAGDGWNTWGEPVSARGNDWETLHLVAEFTRRDEAAVVGDVEALIALAQDSDSEVWIEASTGPAGNLVGSLAVITPPRDYNVSATGGHVWTVQDTRTGAVEHTVLPWRPVPPHVSAYAATVHAHGGDVRPATGHTWDAEEDPWYVVIDREYAPPLAVHYPDRASADRAEQDSEYIDMLCQEDCLDLYVVPPHEVPRDAVLSFDSAVEPVAVTGPTDPRQIAAILDGQVLGRATAHGLRASAWQDMAVVSNNRDFRSFVVVAGTEDPSGNSRYHWTTVDTRNMGDPDAFRESLTSQLSSRQVDLATLISHAGGWVTATRHAHRRTDMIEHMTTTPVSPTASFAPTM